MNGGDTPDAAARSRPPRPKRGAYPTPQEEIDKAPVFVPPGEDAEQPPASDPKKKNPDTDVEEKD